MERKCKICGKPFQVGIHHKKYCSPECAGKNPYTYTRIRRRSVNTQETIKRAEHVARFNQYISEAVECGLSYGQYRMFRDVFGKTFEELKTACENKE